MEGTGCVCGRSVREDGFVKKYTWIVMLYAASFYLASDHKVSVGTCSEINAKSSDGVTL